MSSIPGSVDPNLLLGLDAPDDAAVYRITDEIAIVQTVDFFTPVVDDPFQWGAIAAANALSDIYAMGARPVTALNLVAWPKELDMDLLYEVLAGGAEKAREAGVSIVGGHTIDDEEPKYGMSVTGLVPPGAVVTSSGATAGLDVILTKPLGMGIVSTAIKAAKAPAELAAEATAIMSTLNRAASEAMVEVGVAAATDVTGFGLIGHFHQLLKASGVAGILHAERVPVLSGARELAAEGLVPGGTQRNRSHFSEVVSFPSSVDEVDRIVLFDAQTSGGLLIAVEPSKTQRLLDRLSERSVEATAIGRTVDGVPGSIEVE